MQDGIFVSYSHKDSDIVVQIVKILKESSGKEVWFDHKLRGGENYFSVIANQIIANKYFAFIVSNNSIESDWCLRELEFAASEKRHIIAIWIDNIDIAPRIKLVIQNTHYINWYSTTEKLFCQSIASAFKDMPVITSMKEDERAYNDTVRSDQKYFLDKEQLKKLSLLLREEKAENYSLCFEPENANLLGIAYELGISVEIDLKKATLYYKTSMYAENVEGKFLYAALMYQQHPENPEYLSDMLQSAESGCVLALTAVGDFYYDGKNGFTKDIEKAYEYYERAAKAEEAVAMYYMGYGYCMGEYVPKNLEIAYMYALKSKQKGFARAYRLLAHMYSIGEYVSQDKTQALELYEEAIKRGDFVSYCYQGNIYGELGDHNKQIELYSKVAELAENGTIKTSIPFYKLAIVYEEGEGVEKDLEKAVVYYLKAAARGHAGALEWTVPCILKLEKHRHIRYLEEAYKLNCEGAAYHLGKIAKNNDCMTILPKESNGIKYFETGAELGDIRCASELLYNYSWIVGNAPKSKENRDAALKWFSFFFANAPKDYLDHLQEHDLLTVYYTAYAVELDYDPYSGKPDREFVLYYFKKGVEACLRLVGSIITFATQEYLFPSKLKVDVSHAEDLLNFAVDYWGDYYRFIHETDPANATNIIQQTKSSIIEGFECIAECYKKGRNVKKDRAKTKKYRNFNIELTRREEESKLTSTQKLQQELEYKFNEIFGVEHPIRHRFKRFFRKIFYIFRRHS